MLTHAGCCSRDVPNICEEHLPRHLSSSWETGLNHRDCLGESSGTVTLLTPLRWLDQIQIASDLFWSHLSHAD